MPWRLILFLVVLALVVAFAGFNIQNSATISFGFYTLESVPIFLSLFAAFFLGVLVMLPFTLGRRRRNRKKGAGEKKNSTKGAETPKLTEETRNAAGAGAGEEHAKTGKKARRKGRGKKTSRSASAGGDGGAAQGS